MDDSPSDCRHGFACKTDMIHLTEARDVITNSRQCVVLRENSIIVRCDSNAKRWIYLTGNAPFIIRFNMGPLASYQRNLTGPRGGSSRSAR